MGRGVYLEQFVEKIEEKVDDITERLESLEGNIISSKSLDNLRKRILKLEKSKDE